MMESSPQTADKKPKTIVAMIALASPSLPQAGDVMREVRSLDPDALLAESSEQIGKLLSFLYNGNLAAVSLMPAPLPRRDLEGPCATAWWWPQATEMMQRHTHHLLVMIMGNEGDLVSRALDATRLVAAAAKLTDSIGVYWGAGTIIHQAEEFVRQTQEASRDQAPIHLWIDMRLEQNDDDTYGFFTTGMSQFDQLELEVARTAREPQEILEFTYDLIHYIITQNVTIADGETVGRTADHKVPMKYAPSMWDASRTVLQMEL